MLHTILIANMGILKANFDVLPNGIKTVDGKTYAVFKMIVGFEIAKQIEKNDAKNIHFSHYEWEQLVTSVNSLKWFYTLSKGSIAIKNIYATQKDFNLLFNVKLNNCDKDFESDNFNFGNWFKKSEKRLDAFEDFEYRDFWLKTNDDQNQVLIKQFENSNLNFKKDVNRNNYTEILKRANAYVEAKNIPSENTFDTLNSGKYNLKAIYAQLLDAPLAAERRFGLVREFRILVDDIKKEFGSGSVIDYKIVIQDETTSANMPFSFIAKKVGGTEKYYNGLKKVFFDDNDFKELSHDFYDPYKRQLDGEKEKAGDKKEKEGDKKEVVKNLHPDGIYIKAIYKLKQVNDKDNLDAEIDDPFLNDDPIKGFNVLVKKNTDLNFHSLSPHSSKYDFPKGDSLIEKSSGHLVATSEIEVGIDRKTNKSERKRNNVLFVWRGDNLLVNRISRGMDNSENEQEEGKGKMQSDTDYCNEALYVYENFYTRKDKLINSSQIQFLAGQNYTFALRTVTPTNYYLRSKADDLDSELLDAKELTVEDFDELGLIPSIGGLSNVRLEKTLFPINSPVIIGTKLYKEDSEYVDQARHLVLHKVKNEKSERRFIYPSQLKWEDFKILGYLTQEKLKKSGEDHLTLNEYVSRCIRLEDKINNRIPKLAFSRTSIDYIADLRGTSIYIFPSDLYTASVIKDNKKLLKAFKYTSNYPFYRDTQPVAVTVKQKRGINEIVFKGDDDTVEYKNIPDGIYNFNIYVVDNNFKESTKELIKYNYVPLRLSVLAYPKEPKLTGDKHIPYRNPKKDKTFWYLPISVGQDSATWKSIKYQEETEVLKLKHNDLNHILIQYYKNGGKRLELANDEYPYEMFLEKEGSIQNESLYPFIYSSCITIDYKISDDLYNQDQLSGSFFRLKLNDSEVLEARYDAMGKSFLIFESKGIIISQVYGNAFKLEILFNRVENYFFIKKDGIEWESLKEFINADISINDLEVTEKVIMFTQLDPNCKLQFFRTADYSFISDLKTEYARKKNIQLFGSSIFQAYFPKSKSEFDMGKEGSIFEISIPNNSKPSAPILESEVLLMYSKDDYWNNTGVFKIKENKSENVVRISLQQDFMVEGKSKLGIIISKDTKVEKGDKDVSFIGEDITKLTETDWSINNFRDILDLNSSELFKKYFSSTTTSFYKIGDITYEILEFEPFYNAYLKKWQILLPFKFLKESESLFVELVGLKISPGHGMECLDTKKTNSLRNPFKDKTGTNLSMLSDPIQFPIYSRKRITLKKGKTKKGKTFVVKVESISKHKEKIYYLMFMKEKSDWGYMDLYGGLASLNDKRKFKNLEEFTLYGAKADKIGQILCFDGLSEVVVSREHCHSAVVLEFEIHTNSDLLRNTEPAFETTENPLFDKKGIRLINVAEFKV